jgi:hypothetical protein
MMETRAEGPEDDDSQFAAGLGPEQPGREHGAEQAQKQDGGVGRHRGDVVPENVDTSP